MVTMSTARRRILVVDDMELNRVMTASVLAAKFDVDCIGDGRSALSVMEQARYDLVLMDLDMPDFNEFDVTAAYRRQFHQQEVLIVALSACSDPASVTRALAAGMKDHIGRPISATGLREKVQDLFDAMSPESQTAAIFSRAQFDGLSESFGRPRMETFLDKLLDKFAEVNRLLGQVGPEREAISRQAHDLTSVAGMLGFEEVSHFCRAMQSVPFDEPFDTMGLSAVLRRAEQALRQQRVTKH